MEVLDATSGLFRFKNHFAKVMESCRICMARNETMMDIFNSESENTIEEISFCTGIIIKKEDGLPSKICAQCLTDLSVAFKFKTSCILADETFRKLCLQSNIKAEESDVEFEEIVKYDEELAEEEFEKEIQQESLEPEAEKKVKETKRIKNTKTGRAKPAKRAPIRAKVTTKGRAPRRAPKFKFRKLYCEPCDMNFGTKQECDEHKKEMHKESENWVCEICGKLFVHRASHYTHIKSHLPPKYACDQCEYKTWHKYDLVKHIRIHTGIKMYQCEFCTASYYTSSNLTGHIRRNHMKQRPFECHICRLTFFERSKLNRHIDSHNDVKRFTCEVCHACFTRRCYWKKHLLRMHDIVTPPQRPGRQKTNAVVGEDLMHKAELFLRPVREKNEEVPEIVVIDKNNAVGEFLRLKVDKEV